MEKRKIQLLNFIQHQRIRKDGYVLLASIAMLFIISSVLLYQYRYYCESRQLENELSQIYLIKIKNNLR